MRALGFAADANVGGTTLDDFVDGGGIWPAPTIWIPATTGNVDPGEQPADRNDEVRGRRGNSASFSYMAQPKADFGARAYPEIFRRFLRNALGGAPANTGTAPAAISSVVEPIQSGNLIPLNFWLLREEQLDRVSGAVVNEISAEFPVDGEGTVQVSMDGLYHEPTPTSEYGALPTPNTVAYDDVYSLRDIKAFLGPDEGEQIDCLSGFSFAVSNALYGDARSRFCAGKNIRTTPVDGVTRKLWYPERHKIGPQRITGRLDFGSTRPDVETLRILRHTQKLEVELAAGPLGTTPEADEMLRLTFHNQAPTGGGADALQRDGDQFSSYEFEAYIDPATGKDLTAEFVGTTAVA